MYHQGDRCDILDRKTKNIFLKNPPAKCGKTDGSVRVGQRASTWEERRGMAKKSHESRRIYQESNYKLNCLINAFYRQSRIRTFSDCDSIAFCEIEWEKCLYEKRGGEWLDTRSHGKKGKCTGDRNDTTARVDQTLEYYVSKYYEIKKRGILRIFRKEMGIATR